MVTGRSYQQTRFHPTRSGDGRFRIDVQARHRLNREDIVAFTAVLLYQRELTTAARRAPTRSEIVDHVVTALTMRGSDAIEYDPERVGEIEWAGLEVRAAAIVDRYWPALADTSAVRS